MRRGRGRGQSRSGSHPRAQLPGGEEVGQDRFWNDAGDTRAYNVPLESNPGPTAQEDDPEGQADLPEDS